MQGTNDLHYDFLAPTVQTRHRGFLTYKDNFLVPEISERRVFDMK